MEVQKRILVIGGTGVIGQPVAHALKEAGYDVSVLTRDVAWVRASNRQIPGVDYVSGDIEDETALRQALMGCYGVHISIQSGQSQEEQDRIQHQGTARLARIAAEVGVQHITYVSGYLVSEQFAHIPAEQAKLNAEKAIRASGVPYTIFRPTYFMDIVPRFIQGNRLSIFGKQPHPIHFLAVADFARFVTAAFVNPATANQILYVRGPQPLTFLEAFETYRRIVNPELSISTTPFWLGKLLNRLVLRGAITETLALLHATQQVGEIGNYEMAESIFGVAPTTVEVWCQGRK